MTRATSNSKGNSTGVYSGGNPNHRLEMRQPTEVSRPIMSAVLNNICDDALPLRPSNDIENSNQRAGSSQYLHG
jgi:hypothetical protein